MLSEMLRTVRGTVFRGHAIRTVWNSCAVPARNIQRRRMAAGERASKEAVAELFQYSKAIVGALLRKGLSNLKSLVSL